MQAEYFSLPLALDRFIRKKDQESDREHNRIELSKCSLVQSVNQHLRLLITTGFGEFPGDDNFGCSIWDNDFDNVTSAHKLKEIIRQSLLQAVQQHEKRLGSVRVELVMMQEELPDGPGKKRIKKRIDITIKGILHSTNERFHFNESFFVGPLSF